MDSGVQIYAVDLEETGYTTSTRNLPRHAITRYMTRCMTHAMTARFAAAFYLAATLSVLFSLSAVAQNQSSVRVIHELKHDVSAPLSELDRITPAQPHRFSPRLLKILPTGPVTNAPEYAAPDVALQQASLPPVAANLGLNIDGLGQGQSGFNVDFSPPDTNGAVGATQYVQWVNAQFAVFDKVTGALVAGPTDGNTPWTGFGGGCETNNDGDPIVQYDKMANRWILTQFSIVTLPYTECVAVSTTSDATGTYNRYAFSFGNTDFPDYPKLGVWPDAYYMSFNLFLNGHTFTGADACALDRNAMLAGEDATLICFQQPSSVASLLPSDMDGTIPPSAGEPGFFMNFGKNVIQLWTFHVDFTTPPNSTFTGPTVLPVAIFTPRCFRSCVVQPGTTQRLDALGDRPMYRLAYRQFPDGVESLVFNHSISTGVRWYEVRTPNSAPAVFQQGTFGPDSTTRWMGSIAMDQSSDIALGYSVSSSSVYPSIYFTGRVAADTPGSMEGEQLIVNGSGSQTEGVSRWGDYSAMTVDPVDDCTFWYTQEYIQSNGSFNWNTRISNLMFPNCGNGSGGSPTAVLSATKLTFPKTLIAQTMYLTVTVTNAGNATLNISNVVATGDFAVQSNGCGAQVLAGNNCPITVGFTPAAKGSRTGILQLTDNAANNPQRVTLTGMGMSIALSPTALNFGAEPVGQTSAPQPVTISNVSNTSVNLTGFTISGASADYTKSGNTCGPSLAAGTNCSLNVSFNPTKNGTRNAKLNVANNGGGTATATLTGTGQ
jgi:Abnormal spindle-like microcephaly-assoc'd, ASPM-SPD-2-Hydin